MSLGEDFERTTIDGIRRAAKEAANLEVVRFINKKLKGATIRFPEGNNVPFMVNHDFKAGLPHDVEFAIAESVVGGGLKLVAPGYGGEPYGEGAIYL